jgi:hypothetical protein
MNILPYEDDKFYIKKYHDEYQDIFAIDIDYDMEILKISRVGYIGWIQDLALEILDKVNNTKQIVMIGPSAMNGVAVKLNNQIYNTRVNFDISADMLERSILKERPKVFIGLTTIPSRAKTKEFMDYLVSLSEGQTLLPEKIFVTIAHNYKRFDNISIDINTINKIKSINKVEIIYTEDFGPASKYLGPLIYKKEDIDNSLLVLVDDDKFYSKNLLRHFSIGFKLFPDIKLIGAAKFYNPFVNELKFEFAKYYHGLSGFSGFCIKVKDLDDIVEFNQKILQNIDGAFYNDNSIMKGYISLKQEDILIMHHRECMVDYPEWIDSISSIPNLNREYIEKQIFQRYVK